MADEYSADSGGAEGDAAPPESMGGGAPEGGDDGSFMLPEGASKYAQGLKPGDEIIFKVVSIDGDHVQVKYATPEGGGEGGESKPMMDHFDSEVGGGNDRSNY